MAQIFVAPTLRPLLSRSITVYRWEAIAGLEAIAISLSLSLSSEATSSVDHELHEAVQVRRWAMSRPVRRAPGRTVSVWEV